MGFSRIQLGDGTIVFQSQIQDMEKRLRSLRETNIVALIDLVDKCNHPSKSLPDHGMGGSSKKILQERNFIDMGGNINEPMRKMILTLVSGEGLQIKIHVLKAKL